MESQRQKKIASVIQGDLVEVLQGAAREGGLRGVIISVSKVNVTVDLSIAKVYLSIFPIQQAQALMEGIASNAPLIKHELAKRTKHQLRRMPKLLFFLDDSLEYIDQIEHSLRHSENPIQNPDLLDKRKKSWLNFSFYIAKRYLFTKSKSKAINYITLIASIGIVVGTAALFIVLSGFAGLKAFSLEFTTLTDPDLKLFPKQTKTFFFSQAQSEQMAAIDGIASFSEIAEDQVLMRCDDKFLAVRLKGVDTNYPQGTIDSIVSYGDWMEPDLPQIVSGWDLSNTLGFKTYDITKTIRLYAPKPGTGQLMSIKDAFKSMKVVNVGIFQINDDLNNSLVFTGIENAKYLLGLPKSAVSAIEIITTETADTPQIIAALERLFEGQVVVKNRMQLNAALYKMLNTEQLAVYLIFTLILSVALFNIVGSIIMMILDKKRDLKTLFSMGATKQTIQRVFFAQGILMTVLGGLSGLLLGVVVILLQQHFELVMITSTLAYPVVLTWANVGIAFSTILVLGIIASRLASWRIKKVDFVA